MQTWGPLCAVHAAAEKYRSEGSVEDLMRLGLKSATPECDDCQICQAALAAIREQARSGGTPDQAWMRLKEDSFGP